MKEAKRLSIPVFAMVDTCCDPTDIDYVIPANDDAANSISVVINAMCAAIAEGSEERRLEKGERGSGEGESQEAAPRKEGKPRIKKAVKAGFDAEEAALAEVVAATEGSRCPGRVIAPGIIIDASFFLDKRGIAPNRVRGYAGREDACKKQTLNTETTMEIKLPM